jgi:hypothetical protein
MFNPIDAIEACLSRFYTFYRVMPTRLVLDQQTFACLILNVPHLYRGANLTSAEVLYLGMRVETINVAYIHIEVI